MDRDSNNWAQSMDEEENEIKLQNRSYVLQQSEEEEENQQEQQNTIKEQDTKTNTAQTPTTTKIVPQPQPRPEAKPRTQKPQQQQETKPKEQHQQQKTKNKEQENQLEEGEIKEVWNECVKESQKNEQIQKNIQIMKEMQQQLDQHKLKEAQDRMKIYKMEAEKTIHKARSKIKHFESKKIQNEMQERILKEKHAGYCSVPNIIEKVSLTEDGTIQCGPLSFFAHNEITIWKRGIYSILVKNITTSTKHLTNISG